MRSVNVPDPSAHSKVLMRYEADPRVDDYIKALPDWQQEVCREVHDLVHERDPDVTESAGAAVFIPDGNNLAASSPSRSL